MLRDSEPFVIHYARTGNFQYGRFFLHAEVF